MKINNIKILVIVQLIIVIISKRHLRLNINQLHLQQQSQIDLSQGSLSNGYHLRNHYGYNSHSSPYGNTLPINIKQMMIKRNDGSWTKPVVANVDPNGLIGENCDLKASIYYEHCKAINNCQECNANDICSWCSSTKKCNVQLKIGCSCPDICPYDFNSTNTRTCNQEKYIFGTIHNIAGSKGLVTPEIAVSKIHQKTNSQTIVQDVAKVQVGTQMKRVKMVFHKQGQNKQYNQLTSEWTNQKQPVYLDIPISRIQDKEEHKYYSIDTIHALKEIQQDQEKIMHGYNDQ